MLPDTPDNTVVPFRPGAYTVRLANRGWERDHALALRHQVFCVEQGLFSKSDRDEVDRHAQPIVALSWYSGMADQVVGTVRIHEASPGLWYGSRLAVAEGYRRMACLGTELIRLAVGTAHARGCTRFLAQVQQRNVPLFESLHWQALETIDVRGRPHALMEADLAQYPPCAESELGIVTTSHRVA
ncbi:histone acetyltransferase [Halovibrio salipaludis]|uniref:Histone acetyltransferase n=1 Tax=Halovibrio salipaludis TaxID=2032626 RepID=A0A2A2F4Z2_9GAMM|nr:MSMEG_0567/Sll0786 family nitrogen starvation N-acetyltransferase [Halovibrio salipaludis]PAU80516.1 histone acetyltransferase [Halovibrio salipaludis]